MVFALAGVPVAVFRPRKTYFAPLFGLPFRGQCILLLLLLSFSARARSRPFRFTDRICDRFYLPPAKTRFSNNIAVVYMFRLEKSYWTWLPLQILILRAAYVPIWLAQRSRLLFHFAAKKRKGLYHVGQRCRTEESHVVRVREENGPRPAKYPRKCRGEKSNAVRIRDENDPRSPKCLSKRTTWLCGFQKKMLHDPQTARKNVATTGLALSRFSGKRSAIRGIWICGSNFRGSLDFSLLILMRS